MTASDTPTTPAHDASETLRLILAWLIVALPLAWGVSRTVISAIPLFTK